MFLLPWQVPLLCDLLSSLILWAILSAWWPLHKQCWGEDGAHPSAAEGSAGQYRPGLLGELQTGTANVLSSKLHASVSSCSFRSLAGRNTVISSHTAHPCFLQLPPPALPVVHRQPHSAVGSTSGGGRANEHLEFIFNKTFFTFLALI